ncbi:ABC transporter ATP-binding protein [Azospirillum sp.]|uniref:ABC transporter ATP-binding protein n=1 Tax=Azospirillum sp. TaxID=34012 RepID=UPI003D7195EC
MQSVRMQAVAMEPAARRSAIRIDGLEKIYETRDGERIQALGPISLDVAEGEFITIVGPSGCGKSTLLRMLAGLIDRSAGDIRVRDTSIVGPQPDIGMVFQSPVLLPWKTTLANVMLPAAVLGLDQATSRKRAESLLDMVGLGAFKDKYPSELSGGMQQRVAIARALLHEPSILLMDEPFGALDAMTRETMNQELRRIWRESGKTIVFVTHSIPEAVFLGSRVLVLSPRPGRIADLVEVDLSEDRDLDSMGSDRFGQVTRRIRAQFNARGGIE